MIGEKWISLERNTLHKHSVGHLRRPEQTRVWGCQFLWRWVIPSPGEWEGYSSRFGEGVGISRSWATTHFETLMADLGPAVVPVVSHLAAVLR